MSAGFLYVLANTSLPGLLKVGGSARDPAIRTRELAAECGGSSPFVLLYSQPVDDWEAAEEYAFVEIERTGVRRTDDGEYFMAAPHDVVRVIVEAASNTSAQSGLVNRDPGPTEDAAHNVDEADEHYALALQYDEGTDAVAKSPTKALKHFEKAASLGHAYSALCAGDLYASGNKPIRRDIRKATRLYNFAANEGITMALARMALMFQQEGQEEAAEQHWMQYFAAAVEEVKSLGDGSDFMVDHVRKVTAVYGALYCRMLARADIADVVPHAYLQFFQDEIEQRLLDDLAELDESSAKYVDRLDALEHFRAEIMA